MSKLSAVLGAVGLLCGCAATNSQRESGGHSLTLTVQVETTNRLRPGSRPVELNETLHRGDALSIKAMVDRPAYIYAVLYSEKGWSTALPGKESLVQPGTIAKIPEEYEATLDETAGEEQLIVVASPRPIDAATCALLRLPCASPAEQLLTRGEAPPPPPPPPPRPGIGPRERNGQLVTAGEQHQVQVQSDATGMALLRFPFKHAP